MNSNIANYCHTENMSYEIAHKLSDLSYTGKKPFSPICGLSNQNIYLSNLIGD